MRGEKGLDVEFGGVSFFLVFRGILSCCVCRVFICSVVSWRIMFFRSRIFSFTVIFFSMEILGFSCGEEYIL